MPRGRIVIAVILVTTMLFMWARLLFSGKGGGTTAVSAAVQTSAVTNSGKPTTRLAGVKLPVEPGRHDRLARDFFTTANWKAFQSLQGGSSKMPPSDAADRQGLTEYDIQVIEENLKLDGIISEQSRQACEAFINGKLVQVGGQITIEYKSRQWTLTVLSIQKNNVVLGLENYTLNVAMPQADSLNN